jgi:hypothetical protein
MEPRHQDLVAEEAQAEREADVDEMDQSGANVADDVNPDEDDTGYDDQIEDEG